MAGKLSPTRIFAKNVPDPFIRPSKERTSDYTQAATRIADPESIDL